MQEGLIEVQWRKALFGNNPTRTLARVLGWFCVSFIFFHHLLLPIRIIGSSMSPTYRDGSLNFINRLSYSGLRSPQRGDVIAVWVDGELILKRIIAMPGEEIAITRGVIQINGQPLVDRYACSKVPAEIPTMRLHHDEFFVIGDNRPISVLGKVHQNQILGKIVF